MYKLAEQTTTAFNPIKPYTRYYGNRTEQYIYKGTSDQPENVSQHYLKVSFPDGSYQEYEGADAKARALDSKGQSAYNVNNPFIRATADNFTKNDYRSNFMYNIGRGLGQATASDQPTAFGRFLNTPYTATVGGAGIGGLLGALYSHFIGGQDPLYGGLAGAAAGGVLGYISNQNNPQSKEQLPMVKKSSMWQDPRNYILEKLQGAHDISMADKAILASKVRNMSSSEASDLERLVRSALGIGVGAIIARFLGAGDFGTVVGGLLGAGAAGAMNIGNSLGWFFR